MIDLWGEAVRAIEPKVKPAQRDMWLRPIECVSISDSAIHLRAPNRYHKEWFEDHFLPSILEDMRARSGRDFTVTFELVDEAVAGQPASVDGERVSVPLPSAPPSAPPRDLDPRYTFDTFVVGATNQFAHVSARMVAETPAQKFNPLFLYGGTGQGKTHLLHAIGHEIWRQHPDWKIKVVTCERFVTEFIGAMMNQRRQGSHAGTSLMDDFRGRYRDEPDVLLVDDIQFLANKDSSQDEFFHTFNALHLTHKQIVLTCDKLPGELPGLEDRLRSRFNWGLLAEIPQPDLETRLAILKRKATIEGVILSDDVALFLASNVKSNVRQLEGVLRHLFARAAIEHGEITREFAQKTLQKVLPAAPPGLTVEGIQREVCDYFGVKLQDMKSAKRHRAVAHPRMVAMYLARHLTAMSYPEIGSRFGGKDHSTVISAVRKIERLIGQDPSLRSVVQTLEGRLRNS